MGFEHFRESPGVVARALQRKSGQALTGTSAIIQS